MRYLRMLTNSAVAGLIVAAYLTVLVLHLNPGLGLHPGRSLPLLLTMAGFYGVHAAALFYVLIVLRQVLASQLLSPGWLSVRLLVWLLAGGSSAAAALMWLNLASFQAALDPLVAEHMTAGAVALTACAGLLFALAGLHYSVGRRGSRVSAAALVGLAAASFIGPLAARGPAVDPRAEVAPAAAPGGLDPAAPGPGVTLVLLDGASLEFIVPLVAEGRLPNFGRLLDAGAAMHLATLRPTQPAPVWTAVATGKLPFRHGIRSEATYAFRGGDRPIERLPDYCYAQALVRFGFLRVKPYTSADLQTRPLWDILSGSSISVGVIGWPLTFPARPVHGYIVSEEFSRRGARVTLDGDPAIVYPEPLLPLARSVRDVADPAFAFPPPDAPSPPWAVDGVGTALEGPLAADLAAERLAAALGDVQPTRVTAVRYPGLDAVGHRYLRYALPDAFGDVSDEDRRRYGRVLEQYYAHLDGLIGRALGGMGPDDVLMVVSGFGMEPLGPGKRLLEWVFGNRSLSGTHEGAPDGFLIAYGGPVRRGRVNRGSVLDVTPTVLYLLGLPVARDMDGDARADLFAPQFTAGRPMTFIPSYDR